MFTDEATEKRLRKLTVKGREMFDNECEEFQSKRDACWTRVEDILLTLPNCESLQDYRTLDNNLNTEYRNFCVNCDEFSAYLSRKNTEESSRLLQEHGDIFRRCTETIRKVRVDIKKKKLDLVERLSEVRSNRSSASNVSHKQAKAEAEKVRLVYVKRESELLKQKAELKQI